jgi:3'-5' exonuclease
MTHSTLLFLDIETVPNRVILPPDFGEDAFPPKPIQHRVVAISFLSASLVSEGGTERYVAEECRSGGDLASTEEQFFREFWRRFERDKPRVVTWNGRGFDLPVLVQRAFIYGIPANSGISRATVGVGLSASLHGREPLRPHGHALRPGRLEGVES